MNSRMVLFSSRWRSCNECQSAREQHEPASYRDCVSANVVGRSSQVFHVIEARDVTLHRKQVERPQTVDRICRLDAVPCTGEQTEPQ